jgi:hypothetical protein
MNRPLHRLIAGLLVLSIASTANGELITHAASTDRERITAHLNREDIAAELTRRGITQEQARARVAALSDAEAASLAGRVDELAAAGAVPFLAFLGMAVVALPVIVVGGVILGVAAIAAAINKGSTRSAPIAKAPSVQQPAYSPRVPFQQGSPDSSAFTVSTGLYGAVIPTRTN